jgi:hypothetical protein
MGQEFGREVKTKRFDKSDSLGWAHGDRPAEDSERAGTLG